MIAGHWGEDSGTSMGSSAGILHQYCPELVSDNHTVEPEETPEEGYYLTEDLVDKAIGFIADAKQVAPDKPFFSCISVPVRCTRRITFLKNGRIVQGRNSDDGWDAYRERTFAKQKELGIVPQDAELSRHDPDVANWDALSADEKKLYARMMEVFAEFLTHTDHHYSRLFNFLKNPSANGTTR